MARLVIICVLVVVCAFLAESETLDKKAMVAKLLAARRSDMEAAKKENDVSSLKALLQRKLALRSQKREEVKSATYNKRTDPSDVSTEVVGTQILDSLSSGNKRRMAFFSGSITGGVKKSYEGVLAQGEAVWNIIEGYSKAPCSLGVEAAMDAATDAIDWDSIDWENLHENDFDTSTLTFLRWWTANKCSAFFQSEHAFYFYLWSIFWDGLEKTPCFDELPHDVDDPKSVNFTIAFEKVNSLDPAAWAAYPTPTTVCQLFEMIGEIYFDFFFTSYFDALPEKMLQDIFEDYNIAPFDFGGNANGNNGGGGSQSGYQSPGSESGNNIS